MRQVEILALIKGETGRILALNKRNPSETVRILALNTFPIFIDCAFLKKNNAKLNIKQNNSRSGFIAFF